MRTYTGWSRIELAVSACIAIVSVLSSHYAGTISKIYADTEITSGFYTYRYKGNLDPWPYSRLKTDETKYLSSKFITNAILYLSIIPMHIIKNICFIIFPTFSDCFRYSYMFDINLCQRVFFNSRNNLSTCMYVRANDMLLRRS